MDYFVKYRVMQLIRIDVLDAVFLQDGTFLRDEVPLEKCSTFPVQRTVYKLGYRRIILTPPECPRTQNSTLLKVQELQVLRT